MKTLGCIWQVRAGMIPGEEMPEHSRNYELTGDERGNLEDFIAMQAEAEAYGRFLQIECMAGRTCNWTRIDFMWV